MEPPGHPITFAGPANSGAQIGVSSGPIANHFYTGSPAPDSRPSPTIIIPFRRDRHFVERSVLDQIGYSATQPAARVGVLAVEYAYRRREADPQLWVFWVHASSGVRFEQSYRKIAQQVGISSWADPKADILSRVYGWLSNEQNGRWTMVVDNADSDEVMFGPQSGNTDTRLGTASTSTQTSSGTRPMSDHLSSAAHGSIVITSRSRRVVERLIEYPEDIFEVGPMRENAGKNAIILLVKKLAHMRQTPSREDLCRLVHELDYMPLAITQAAAYISQQRGRVTLVQYLGRLEASYRDQENLLQRHIHDPRRDSEASNSIIATWHISFEHIREARDSAARLLALMSLFDREGIPERLLQGSYTSPSHGVFSDSGETNCAPDQYEFDDDVAVLQVYSLISVGTNEQLFDMHRLVQFSTRKWLELRGELADWQSRYVDVLDAAFPTGDYKHWPICQTLFPHVEVLLSYSIHGDSYLKKQAAVLFRGAWFADWSGRYLVASEMARASLKAREQVLGSSDVLTLQSVDYLARVLQAQGRYSEAEILNRRALAGYEKELGASHPSTLTSVSNLATVLRYQGRYSEAEALNRRALAGSEKELGASHPDTLTSVSNLAAVLQAQGRYSEAEALNRRALAGYEKELGASHPDTLTSVYCLAYLLHSQKEYEASLQLYNRAVRGLIDVLGPAHPTTLACQENRERLLLDIDANTTGL
ncbi:hypothetical protein LTR51_008643 [Lithohypha guttulata]|nr:hypothetical protein LTR51_008643 [Lithohypha guttulata]